MKKQEKNARISSLRKGKIRRVGFLEKLCLKIIGYSDGKRGLPRESTTGWMSPHLEKEVRSYDEFASRVWGRLQIEEEESYARLGELLDSIAHTKALLGEAESALNEAKEKPADRTRQKGESRLTDEQVAARRSNERAQKLAPFEAHASVLQEQLAAEIDEFAQIHSKIVEKNNSTRLICNRVRDHIYQRLNIYWNAVLRKHPDRAKMPVVPCIEVTSRSEEIYMEPHKHLMQKAASINKEISHNEEEAA